MNRRGKNVLISGKGGKLRQGTKEPINPEAIEHYIDVILTFACKYLTENAGLLYGFRRRNHERLCSSL
jgi:hypothetical protein